MKVLLTGARGQLGSALQSVLRDVEWVATDVDELDITRLDAVRRAVDREQPEAVINAAAYTDVDGAESDPQAAYRLNAAGARNLALAAAAAGIPLVQLSTDYVFDGCASRPYHEYDRPRPLSVYGASKLAGEEAVRALHARHFVVRTAWLYHTQGRNFPASVLSLAGREEIRVVSDQFGSPTYAPHLARALGELLATGAYGTYHIAGSGEASWYELTCALFELMGMSTPVRPVSTRCFPRPAARPRYSVLETIQEPRIILPPWREGLAELVRSLRPGNRGRTVTRRARTPRR